jgi:hypothetical protein
MRRLGTAGINPAYRSTSSLLCRSQVVQRGELARQ